MSLIECKECGKTISDTAKSCPHCGAAYAKTDVYSKTRLHGIVFMGVVFVIGGIILLLNFVYVKHPIIIDRRLAKEYWDAANGLQYIAFIVVWLGVWMISWALKKLRTMNKKQH